MYKNLKKNKKKQTCSNSSSSSWIIFNVHKIAMHIEFFSMCIVQQVGFGIQVIAPRAMIVAHLFFSSAMYLCMCVCVSMVCVIAIYKDLEYYTERWRKVSKPFSLPEAPVTSEATVWSNFWSLATMSSLLTILPTASREMPVNRLLLPGSKKSREKKYRFIIAIWLIERNLKKYLTR